MKYIKFLLATVLLACVTSQGFADVGMTGSDRDEHGCIGSAGYSWSEEAQECVRVWETTTYATFDDLIEAEPTCKMANDGCNNVAIVNGQTGMMTKMYCPDIYDEGQEKQWSCEDKKIENETIGFLSANDQNQYKTFKNKLGDSASARVLSIISKFGDKVLEKKSYDLSASIRVTDSAVIVFENAISALIDTYPADASMSKRDTQTYYILTVAKYEIQIMRNRWTNRLPENTIVPEDFIEGATYDTSVQECNEKGGTMTQDGNGIYVCIED